VTTPRGDWANAKTVGPGVGALQVTPAASFEMRW
jgi:hypothetical protein